MEWFYAVGDERRGPISDAEFRVLVSNGTVRPATLVWRHGMADWTAYGALVGGTAAFAGETGTRYAGFWIRFVAKFIDIIILNIVGFMLGLIGSLLGTMLLGDESVTLLNTIIYAIAAAVSVAYYVLFVGAYGATPGKMALGLRIVRATGEPVSYLLALARYVSAVLNYLTLGVGWFMAGWTREKRALHDFICETRVIHA